MEQKLQYEDLENLLEHQNVKYIEIKRLKIRKSTNINFWGILTAVHLKGFTTVNRFVVGNYMEDSKPKCFVSFLKDYIAEV